MENDFKYFIALVVMALITLSCSVLMGRVDGDDNQLDNELFQRTETQMKIDSLRLIEFKKSKEKYKFPEKYDRK